MSVCVWRPRVWRSCRFVFITSPVTSSLPGSRHFRPRPPGPSRHHWRRSPASALTMRRPMTDGRQHHVVTARLTEAGYWSLVQAVSARQGTSLPMSFQTSAIVRSKDVSSGCELREWVGGWAPGGVDLEQPGREGVKPFGGIKPLLLCQPCYSSNFQQPVRTWEGLTDFTSPVVGVYTISGPHPHPSFWLQAMPIHTLPSDYTFYNAPFTTAWYNRSIESPGHNFRNYLVYKCHFVLVVTEEWFQKN